MDEILRKAVEEAGLPKVTKKEKESFVRRTYIFGDVTFMTMDEVMMQLRADGIAGKK